MCRECRQCYLHRQVLVAVRGPGRQYRGQGGQVGRGELGGAHKLLLLVEAFLPDLPVLVSQHLAQLLVQLAGDVLHGHEVLHIHGLLLLPLPSPSSSSPQVL